MVLKADGSCRPVIDLRVLKKHVAPHHFEMESIDMVKGLIKRGDWIQKLDLKYAYLTVPIHQEHKKYLHFSWQGQLWQFRVLPFGLNSAH